MELGGNMPGDLVTRYAIATGARAPEVEPIPIPAGVSSNNDFELALPSGDTRQARQQARSEDELSQKSVTRSSRRKVKSLGKN